MTKSDRSALARGDVALVRFVFADEQGTKRRPVLILSNETYHAARTEVIVVALTSNVARVLPGDHLIKEWRKAGLPLASVATAIVRTIKASMIESKLGHLPDVDLRAVSSSLKGVLDL